MNQTTLVMTASTFLTTACAVLTTSEALLFPLAQVTPTPQVEIVQPQEVRSLPGKLDTIPVFNSNSPEVVQKEGILLSTFPPIGKATPSAHLNFPFRGRFDIFAHHIAKPPTPEDLRTLYLGIILSNPGTRPVRVNILQAASYLSQPDAPFIELPSFVENPAGSVYSGPGSRVMNDILRGVRQTGFPSQLVIPPKQSQMLLNLPIPVRTLEPPLNGRSTLIRLQSNGVVYAASLARYAPVDAPDFSRDVENLSPPLEKALIFPHSLVGKGVRGLGLLWTFPRQVDPQGNERPPTLEEWQKILDNGELAGPRDSEALLRLRSMVRKQQSADRTPTPPNATTERMIYGRVAGVAQGSVWQAKLVNRPNANFLSIPAPGQAFSYGLSTLPGGKLGTNQSQSARMLARYSDTAYFAHGNYGVQYSLGLPLVNPTRDSQTVTLAIQTPLKQDEIQAGLRFLEPPAKQVFFRGTVQIRYTDDTGLPQTRYVHLVQRRGQQGEALVTLKMSPNQRRLVKLDFLYPPDASPPQVLTVKTLE